MDYPAAYVCTELVVNESKLTPAGILAALIICTLGGCGGGSDVDFSAPTVGAGGGEKRTGLEGLAAPAPEANAKPVADKAAKSGVAKAPAEKAAGKTPAGRV